MKKLVCLFAVGECDLEFVWNSIVWLKKSSVRKLSVLLCSGSFTIQSSLLQVFCEETGRAFVLKKSFCEGIGSASVEWEYRDSDLD